MAVYRQPTLLDLLTPTVGRPGARGDGDGDGRTIPTHTARAAKRLTALLDHLRRRAGAWPGAVHGRAGR